MRLRPSLSLVCLCACTRALSIPPWLDDASDAPAAAEPYDRSLSASRSTAGASAFSGGLVNQQEALKKHTSERLVNITLGVMSRCPDAEYCEEIFDQVLDRVGDMVRFDLTYIGKLNASESDYGVTCKHGPAECLGNIHQLCVKDAYPDQAIWFDSYIDCVNYGRQGDEKSARECAQIGRLDWDGKIAPCVEGSRGRSLLRDSVRRSEMLGIERSCSVLFNERLVCIRDDGQWRECDRHDVADFAAKVRKEYQKANA